MRREEDKIQRAVFQHFAARAMPGVFVFAVPNGGKRSRIEAAIMKGLGVHAGVPDIFAVKDGRAFGLELKAPGGRVSTAQAYAIHDLVMAGATVGITYGLDDALAWLERKGLLRGVAV